MNKILLLIFFLTSIAYAQVNTEKFRARDDFRGFTGYTELSGTIKTGNTEETEADLNARLDWKLDGMSNFAIFNSESKWIDGRRITSELLFHLRNVIDISPKFKTEIFAQVNYDKKVLINDRELVGAGIRYKVLDFDNAYFSLGTAYMYEHENYDLPENSVHPRDVQVSRWSNYVSALFDIREGVELSGVVYYQPMFDEFSDYRIFSESNITVALNTFLALTVNFGIRHDSLPPDGIKSTDTNTNFGVMVKF